MRYLLSLLMGFAASGIGVIPPGLLNITALRISIHEGTYQARTFVLGALSVIVAECYLALIFARYLGRHPEVVLFLREIAFVIFVCLGLYFLFWAKKVEKKEGEMDIPVRKNRFLLGMFLSALNFLTVPFYVAVGLTLKSYKIFHFEQPEILLFVIGVLCGGAFGFWCFVTFFMRMKRYTGGILQHINRIIGVLLLSLSLLTLSYILRFYYPEFFP